MPGYSWADRCKYIYFSFSSKLAFPKFIICFSNILSTKRLISILRYFHSPFVNKALFSFQLYFVVRYI